MIKPLRVLTPEEFEKTVIYMRMSKENLEIVRKVLVQGVPIGLVAKEVRSKSSQSIEKAVRRVWTKFLDSLDLPKGWVTMRVNLPVDEAMHIKARERELRQKLIKDNLFKIS